MNGNQKKTRTRPLDDHRAILPSIPHVCLHLPPMFLSQVVPKFIHARKPFASLTMTIIDRTVERGRAMTALHVTIEIARATESMATPGDKTHISVAFRPGDAVMADSRKRKGKGKGSGSGSGIDHRRVVRQCSIAVGGTEGLCWRGRIVGSSTKIVQWGVDSVKKSCSEMDTSKGDHGGILALAQKKKPPTQEYCCQRSLLAPSYRWACHLRCAHRWLLPIANWWILLQVDEERARQPCPRATRKLIRANCVCEEELSRHFHEWGDGGR